MSSCNVTSWQDFFIRVLKEGPVPRHIAYIMDGNRRFAREKGMAVIKGHEKGYRKLIEAQDWCRAVGIYAVTAYAFSIENFKRTKEEVSDLMNLFEKAVQEMLDDIDTWLRRGCQIRVMGRLELFPEKLQRLSGQIMEKTRHCTTHVFTLAAPYTARDDMTYAIRQLMDGVESGMIEPEDVSEGLMEQCLQTRDLPPVDMLIRTSGEMRFSDFMLWQSSYSFICFEKVMWPQYGFWNFIGGILLYQMHAKHLKPLLQKTEKEINEEKSDAERGTRITDFLKYIDIKSTEVIRRLTQF